MNSFMICNASKYYLRNQIKENETSKACSTDGGNKRCMQGLVGKPEGERQLRKPTHRWDENLY